MRAIRPTLSGLLLAVMLLVSEGIAVSLHWCCGAVESLAVFAAAQPSCCDEGSSTSSCTLDQRDECCQTATAYLLLPNSSLRAGERPAVHNLSSAVLLPAELPVPHHRPVQATFAPPPTTPWPESNPCPPPPPVATLHQSSPVRCSWLTNAPWGTQYRRYLLSLECLFNICSGQFQ